MVVIDATSGVRAGPVLLRAPGTDIGEDRGDSFYTLAGGRLSSSVAKSADNDAYVGHTTADFSVLIVASISADQTTNSSCPPAEHHLVANSTKPRVWLV
ncbi:hypothetical protein [Ensifer aridi]|uniref:hypothetical protein n=1 Tax=Ensifer aridi TaxID=1708715 RepID=UPI00111C65DA|nr:hypothetical protein [Ensifer aridi]